jgi:alcohol dehydrogenase class IV
MLLPAITAFSLGGAPHRYAQAAVAMGWAEAGDDDAAAGAKLIAGLRALCADLEVGRGSAGVGGWRPGEGSVTTRIG